VTHRIVDLEPLHYFVGGCVEAGVGAQPLRARKRMCAISRAQPVD
jgi:hypothetical protein